ncbi:MAG: 2-phospho-L-lactate guanylyltransferase [Vicinamibacterales bacterium]
MNTLSVRVIVPMRPVAACKRRLAREVPSVTREALVLLMLKRTVGAITRALGAGACWVVGGDSLVRQIAEEAGGIWLEDVASDLNATVLGAMRRAHAEGAKAALFVPADVPMIAAEDILAIVLASDGYTRPVGVEATADGGTNALLVPAGMDLPPALGHRSYSRHREHAERAGATLVAAPAAGLVFDLDSPADLAYAKAHVPGFATELAQWEQLMALDVIPGEQHAKS